MSSNKTNCTAMKRTAPANAPPAAIPAGVASKTPPGHFAVATAPTETRMARLTATEATKAVTRDRGEASLPLHIHRM